MPVERKQRSEKSVVHVAGIDVGGTRKGFDIAVVRASGTALHLVPLNGTGRPTKRVPSPDAVVEVLRPYSPAVIAIDSPSDLALPGTKSRQCERDLKSVPPPAVAPAPRWSENAGAVIG